MKKILLVLIIGIFLITSIGLASAVILEEEKEIIFKQYEYADLKLPCSFNGTNCDNTAVCNISIVYPNQSIFMVENQLMTNTGNGMPNYTLPNSDILGIYNYKMTCTQDAISASTSNTFKITTTGINSNNKLPIFLLIFSVVLLAMGFIFESPPIGFFSGILFVMVGIYLMIYGFGDITDLYTRAFALITISLGMILSMSAGYSWIED